MSQFIKPDMFGRLEARYVMAELLNMIEKYNVVPTRPVLREHIESKLSVDDPFEQVLQLVDRKSDYREVPIIKDLLLSWARKKAFGQIYTTEAMDAYKEGNYDHIEKLVNEANKITDVGNTKFSFLDSIDILFEPDTIAHRTTGFSRLDKVLNNGGPSPKEVICWLAPTNVGKSILLCNNAMSSLRGPGPVGNGQDVLLVTFELDVAKTAMRCLASTVGIPLDKLASHQDLVKRTINSIKQTYKKKFYIYELPPDECSVNHIYAIIANLKRTEGWKPDVVVLDYMDLMISRHKEYNKDEYTRQKHVATEIRGLAKNEEVLVFTATQTNRGGMDGDRPIDLNKSAESFGKQFALDYVISLNQSMDERSQNPAQLRFFVAKNRNGPKHVTITCEIDYSTMVVKEANTQPVMRT
jgi:replicative DNA helicase